MRITERDFDAFAEDHFPNMDLVRDWADCKIWSTGVEQPLLVLVDNTSQRVAIFEYDTAVGTERGSVVSRRNGICEAVEE